MLHIGVLDVGKGQGKGGGGGGHTPSREPVHYVLDMGSVADMGSAPYKHVEGFVHAPLCFHLSGLKRCIMYD